MSDYRDLVERYIAAWNETNAQGRRALIARTFTESARYVDPLAEGEGQSGIDALIAGVQAKFPSHSFALKGKIDAHHDRVRFSWTLAPQGGEAIVDGTDFATVAGDGRLQHVTGFLDRVPARAA
jgi:SnoaL-like protein